MGSRQCDIFGTVDLVTDPVGFDVHLVGNVELRLPVLERARLRGIRARADPGSPLGGKSTKSALLARHPDTGRVFVRHEPSLPSGGQRVDIETGAFLIAAGNGPERQGAREVVRES